MFNFFNKPRNPNRIPEIMDKLKILWENSHDLRFFQLLNAIGLDSRADYFFLEDDELLHILNEEINKLTKENNK